MALKIGVVGFSSNQFNHKEASLKLKELLDHIVRNHGKEGLVLVSGYTNSGVPKIAYRWAVELRMETVGFSAKQALTVDCGLYPVDKVILVGEKFGEESQSFVEYIDILIRIGGGKQSRHEVELFKEHNGLVDLETILFEVEIN